MKKICHVTSAHNRYDIRIFEKECSSLASVYDVYLIVNDSLPDETKNGVHIVSTGFTPKSRQERMTKSVPIIYEKIKEVDAEIYHFHDPELLPLLAKVSRRKKTIFDAHENTEEQILDKTWIKPAFRKIAASTFKVIEKMVLKKCNAIVTVTPSIVSKMRHYNENVVMVTNYPILQNVDTTSKYNPQSDYVFFAGGVSRQWCHDRIIKALAYVSEIKYRFAGPAEQGYVDNLKQLEQWKNVEYMGRIPHDKVWAEYSSAVAGMAVNECEQIKGEGSLGNTKLFEIMSSGVPVICTNYTLWKEIVEENGCGICVSNDNIEEIAMAIQYIKDHPEEAAQMGINGRKAVQEKYNWGSQERVLLELYNSVLN